MKIENLSHSFKTDAEVTDRTIMVAEAFGLGIDETKEFPIYKNFNLEIKDNDIVYITGDSGSGKSWIVKNVFCKLKNSISFEDLKIDDNEILIEGVGENLNDALKKLNTAGLGDAFLYLRKYKQLSDGQKYRYRIAKFLDTNADVWIFDEFCATLDRTTAKIVAFNLQKIARKLNKLVICATTHTDLFNALKPSVLIEKGYEADVEVIRFDLSIFPKRLEDIYKDIKVEKGTKEDYKKLSRFHYRDSKLGAVRGIYKMTFKDEIMGVIVITYPFLALKGRNIYTNKKYSRMTTENCKKINEEFSCISRVVLHPKYRGIGLGYHLVGEYFKKFAETKYIETLAVMANYSKFFHRAGMTEVITEKDKKRVEQIARLEKYGFNTSLLSSVKYNKTVYNQLNDEQKEEVKVIVKEILNKYKGQIVKLFSKGKSIDEIVEENLFRVMKELPRPDTLYLIWENKTKNKGEKDEKK